MGKCSLASKSPPPRPALLLAPPTPAPPRLSDEEDDEGRVEVTQAPVSTEENEEGGGDVIIPPISTDDDIVDAELTCDASLLWGDVTGAASPLATDVGDVTWLDAPLQLAISFSGSPVPATTRWGAVVLSSGDRSS